MNNPTIFTVIFLVSVFISSVSQVLLKTSANKQYRSKIKEYLNPLVLFAYFLFFASTLLTVYAFKYIPLSVGPILESTGYIFIGVLGFLFLKEKFTKKKLLGMAVIILGVIIFSIK